MGSADYLISVDYYPETALNSGVGPGDDDIRKSGVACMGVEVLGSADIVNSIGCPFADGVIVVVSKVSGEFSAVTDSGGVNHSDS